MCIRDSPKAVRQIESHIRTLMNQPKNGATVNTYINHAISKAIAESNGDENVVREFGWFKDELGNFDFALTRPYFDLHEKNEPNSGGLFSVTINPTTCKAVSYTHLDVYKRQTLART